MQSEQSDRKNEFELFIENWSFSYDQYRVFALGWNTSPVTRLLGHSGFVDAVGFVEASAGNNIQEIKFLGSCLMWNDAVF